MSGIAGYPVTTRVHAVGASEWDAPVSRYCLRLPSLTPGAARPPIRRSHRAHRPPRASGGRPGSAGGERGTRGRSTWTAAREGEAPPGVGDGQADGGGGEEQGGQVLPALRAGTARRRGTLQGERERRGRRER